jgi:hypothetical protein
MLDFTKLSKDTAELAYSSTAFTAGRMAAALALGDIMRETRAAKEATLEAANEFIDQNEGDDLRERPDMDVATDGKATFEEWCAVLATANDELLTLANGAKWPRVQDVDSMIDWLKTQSAAPVRPDDIAACKVLIEAFNKGRPVKLTDEEVTQLVAQENASKAEFFASQYVEHGDDIADRIKDQVANTKTTLSFHTALNNLPERSKLQIVNAVLRKIDAKCDELLTGKKRSGAASPVAKIPMLARATLMSLLRGDQEDVKIVATRMAHAE